MIEIEPKGSYFQVDSEGYLINPTSLFKIQPEWLPAIKNLIEEYKLGYGNKIRNIMVRGSVAKGEAVKNISDFDTFAYVDLSQDEPNDGWIIAAKKKLKAKYPFVHDFEIGAEPLTLLSDPKERIWLIQSLCIFGDEIEMPKIKPGVEMYTHFPMKEKRFNKYKERIALLEDDDKLMSSCTWMMKNILRVGFEMTMERSKRYTRDLYLCYKDFSEYYPDKEPQMKEVLYYAINPIADKNKLLDVISSIIPWMIIECETIKNVRS